jgi:hypothetical protein
MQAVGYLGGQPYSPMIRQAGSYVTSAVFALDSKCSRLDLHVAGTSDSANSSTSYAYLDAKRVGSPGFASMFAGSVMKDGDPIHVVRGADQVSTVEQVSLSASTELGNAVGWGAARVYCRS